MYFNWLRRDPESVADPTDGRLQSPVHCTRIGRIDHVNSDRASAMYASLSDVSRRVAAGDGDSPFSLANDDAYAAWRARKLELRRSLEATRALDLGADGKLAAADLAAAARQVDAFGFVLFEGDGRLDKAAFLALNRQLGLERLDANPGADTDRVTSLTRVDDEDPRAQYVPYTNRALNWHTDGYYNDSARAIRAFALYCVQPAARGGGNFLFDHEYLYLQIRDRAPDLLRALMRPDLMRVPANVQNGRVVRAEETGPVFAIDGDGGGLQMRYTSRPRNIVWKRDRQSTLALGLVRELLMAGDGLVELRLRRGQGLVCSNLLHGREAYADDPAQPPRLVFRARYLDPVRPGVEPPAERD